MSVFGGCVSEVKGAKQAVTNAFKPPLCLDVVESLGAFCLHVASTYGHAAKLSLLLTTNAANTQGCSLIPDGYEIEHHKEKVVFLQKQFSTQRKEKCDSRK